MGRVSVPTKKPELWNRPQVEEYLGLGRSWIYNVMNPSWRHYDPSFPKPIHIGSRRVAWVASEVVDWVNKKREER